MPGIALDILFGPLADTSDPAPEEAEIDLSLEARNVYLDEVIETTHTLKTWMQVMAKEDGVDLERLEPDPHDLQLRVLTLLKEWNVAVETHDTESMARIECAIDAERCAFLRALDEAEAQDVTPPEWVPYDHPADVAPSWVP